MVTTDGLPGRHRSLWTTDVDPASYPSLSGDLEVDVVVVGGGLTGMTIAVMCKDAGRSVAVLEADSIAGGTTGGTTGKVTSQHDLFYATALDELGESAARRYAEANQAAIGTMRELADRHSVDPYASQIPSYIYTRDPDMVGTLQAEVDAARRLGLPASFANDIGLPFDVEGAVKFDGQLQIHAPRLVHGFARAVHGGGSSVHEDSRVVDMSEDGDTVLVSTELATVRAKHGVVATLLPITDRGFEFAKTRPTRSYGIAVELDGEPPEPMYISAESPKRSLRHYHGNDGAYLVVVGEGHETGHGDDLTRHYRALINFAEQHFPVRSVAYRWSAQDYMSVDGVPYVGRLDFTDHIYVATGFKKWGLSNGTVAAQIIHDAIEGRDNPWTEVFDSQRSEPASKVATLVKENLHVARRFISERVSLADPSEAERLEPGQGIVVRAGERPVALSKDESGQTRAVSAVCTHMGCVLTWNDAETTWDCPCHGSRFDTDGAVLTGPATRDLDTAHVPDPG